MRRFFSLCLIALCAFALTACGPRDHSVLAGTAVGAVAGAGITAAFDGHPLVGAAVGAGLGAAAGAVIDQHNSRHDRHHGGHHGGPRPAPRHHGGHRR